MQQNTHTQPASQSTRQNPFLIYPQSAIAAELTQSQRALLCTIITKCRQTGSLECKLYNRQIATMSGLARVTVEKALPVLKRKGYIAIHGFLRGRVIALLKDFKGEQFLKVPVIQAKPAARLALAYVQSRAGSYHLVFPSNTTGGASCAMSAGSFSRQVSRLKAAGLLHSKCIYDRDKLHWRRYLKPNLDAIAQAAIVSVKSILTASQVTDQPSAKPQTKVAAKYAPVYSAYRQECEALISAHRIKAPSIIDKRTQKQVGRLASEYGISTLCECIHKAAADWWIVSTGFALSTILAARVFNRLLNGRVSTQQQDGGKSEYAPVYSAYRQECEALVAAGKLKQTPSAKGAANKVAEAVKRHGADVIAKCIHTAANRAWIVNTGYRLEVILNAAALETLLDSEEE